MPDLEDHPFSPRNVAAESGASDKSERAWLRWTGVAEGLFGHDLDGDDVNEHGCGYSMDEAVRMFDSGITAETYVADVRRRARYHAPVST